MSVFGWCLDGHHTNCRKEFVRIGNNGEEDVVIRCECTTCNHHTQQ